MHPQLRRFALMAVLLCGPAAAPAVQVGDPAPDFTLVDVHGVSHSLAGLRGNAVLLAFIGYG